jgi:hypothetical protein
MEFNVGITGLRDLQNYQAETLEKNILEALSHFKQNHDSCVMVSSLAKGADQLCARIGLALGYGLIVALPFPEYRDTFEPEDLESFDALSARARETVLVSKNTDAEAAYLAAGRYVADRCDVLLAVWDGVEQTSVCGTQAVIAYARTIRKPVRIIAPEP